MNEPADNPFHDWVRQSLQTYRPPHEPGDWSRVQRKLRRRRWWRIGLFSGLSLLMLLGVGWYVNKPETNSAATGKPPSSLSSPVRTRKAVPTVSSADASGPIAHRNVTSHPPKVLRSRPASAEPAIRLKLSVDPIRSRAFAPLPAQFATLTDRRGQVLFSPEETAIRQQMLTGDFGSDSTAYQALDRNIRQWPRSVVVCDLTTSMYPYSTQVFAWLRRNARNPAIEGFVFFTDCDSLGQPTQPGGPPGQFYVTRQRDATGALPVLLRAARNTLRNDDDAENDVEALQFAQKVFPDARHLILLADNISAVKDMDRLAALNRPVHVVLCGTTGSEVNIPYQTDYQTIAQRTNGTLHTLEDDLAPNALSRNTLIRVGLRYYRYQVRRKRFKRTNFDYRPTHLLGLFWL